MSDLFLDFQEAAAIVLTAPFQWVLTGLIAGVLLMCVAIIGFGIYKRLNQ